VIWLAARGCRSSDPQVSGACWSSSLEKYPGSRSFRAEPDAVVVEEAFQRWVMRRGVGLNRRRIRPAAGGPSIVGCGRIEARRRKRQRSRRLWRRHEDPGADRAPAATCGETMLQLEDFSLRSVRCYSPLPFRRRRSKGRSGSSSASARRRVRQGGATGGRRDAGQARRHGGVENRTAPAAGWRPSRSRTPGRGNGADDRQPGGQRRRAAGVQERRLRPTTDFVPVRRSRAMNSHRGRAAVPVKEFSHLLAWLRANRRRQLRRAATGSLPHFFALMVATRRRSGRR